MPQQLSESALQQLREAPVNGENLANITANLWKYFVTSGEPGRIRLAYDKDAKPDELIPVITIELAVMGPPAQNDQAPQDGPAPQNGPGEGV